MITNMDEHADLKVYINCLQSAKLRLALVEKLCSGDLTIDHESIDAEFACLQLRKCLELIAFSSVAAHKEIYSQAYADFYTHWKAKGLLERMGKLHAEFYPKPIVVERDGSRTVKLSQIMNGYLTKDEFVFLFDTCSNALHEWNPYRTDSRILDLEKPLQEWVNRIRRLLEWHVVHLFGGGGVWIVQLNDPSTGTVRAYPAAPVT
jgi:hypothetical protein